MDSTFVDNDTVFAAKAEHLAGVDRTKKNVQKRPSFRRGLKKIGSGIGAVGSGVLTIATVPLALGECTSFFLILIVLTTTVGLPFALIGGGFSPSGNTVGHVGAALAIPCIATFSMTTACASGASEPNLRLAGSYHESRQIRACIARIQMKLAHR